MYNLEKFKGVIVAFYAPYDENGEISIDAAIKLAAYYKALGINCLYLNGSSGEGFLLSLSERKKLVEAITSEFKDEMNFIVHVGAAATSECVELARHAEQYGVDALSAVPSVYYRLPESSIENHWKTIIGSTELPFVIYNIPQLTGYDLSLNLLTRMIENKQVIGVKNSSINVFQIEQFKKTGGDKFIVFNGSDEQYLGGRVMGAEAGIGGTYGAMPELFLKLEQLIVAGKLKEAQKTQGKINEIIAEMLTFNNIYAVAKEILKFKGVNIGTVRLPMLPVKDCEIPKLKALYEKIDQYTNESN